MAKWDLVKEQLSNIEEMARNGNTENEIIEYLRIGKKTFYRYKKEHPELQEALAEGYRTSLKAIEAAQYKLAIGGYKYEEITQERDKNGDLVVTKIVIKEAQPNQKALENILKNKYPAKWNEVSKININGEISQKPLPDLPSHKVSELAKLLIEEESEENED